MSVHTRPFSTAAQLLTIEIISQMLVTTSPPMLGAVLTEHLRELSGARTVMVLVNRPGSAQSELLNVSPLRRAIIFSQAEIDNFCHVESTGVISILTADLPADHPLQAQLLRSGIRSLARYPLRVGGDQIGMLLLFDLPGIDRVAEINQIITLLAPPIALSLKNALAFRLIEQQALMLELRVEERTAELRESEERYRLAIQATNDGLWEWNAQTNQEFFSPRWCEIIGFSYDDPELVHSYDSWAERIHPEDYQRVMKAVSDHRDQGLKYDVEYRHRHRSGEYRWQSLRGQVIYDAGGKPAKMVGCISDITERKQSEEALRKQNADMEQFIYTVSHDLRSPLVTVKTFMGYLEKDMAEGDRERLAQDIQFIHNAADKMKLLLDELLEMSRIDRVEPPHIEISLRELLSESLDALAGIINERKVEILLPDSDLKLFGDRQRLCRIWQNLIENAIKYSGLECSPRIEIGARQESGDTLFFVKDNGIGIEPRYHSRIFGIFDKLDPKSPGAGLGLSMVQRLVEKYGGRVWVESEGDGNGACFYFTLPQAFDLIGTRPDR